MSLSDLMKKGKISDLARKGVVPTLGSCDSDTRGSCDTWGKKDGKKTENRLTVADVTTVTVTDPPAELRNPSVCSDMHGHTNNDISTHSETENAKLMSALTTACEGLEISPKELKESLSPEDIQDWHQGDITGEALRALAQMMVERRQMDQGITPAHFTAQTQCNHCGLVPIFKGAPASVAGCPWCHNHPSDKEIPGL